MADLQTIRQVLWSEAYHEGKDINRHPTAFRRRPLPLRTIGRTQLPLRDVRKRYPADMLSWLIRRA